jgi:hypothetical protein
MCFESGSLCPSNAKFCCYALMYGRVFLRSHLDSESSSLPFALRYRTSQRLTSPGPCALSSSPRIEYENPLLDAGTRLLDEEFEVETVVVSLNTSFFHASSVARIDPVPDLDNKTGDALVVIDVETLRCTVCRP